MAAHSAANDLFAQQLRAEGAHTQHMSDSVGVPVFSEYGGGDDTADGFAELAELAYGVHDFMQKILIGEVVGGSLVECTD